MAFVSFGAGAVVRVMVELLTRSIALCSSLKRGPEDSNFDWLDGWDVGSANEFSHLTTQRLVH